MKEWPTTRQWYGVDLYEQPEYYDEYLCDAEDEINKKYKIFSEPSIQAGRGSVFIYDESGEDRFEGISVDFQEWCNKELEMAASSNSEREYKQRYENYIRGLIGE